MIASPARYSILCALVLGGLALLTTQGAQLGLLPALLLLPLAAWPAWLALAYPATVRRIEARTSLREGESPWWGPLLGGALWKQVAAVPVALLAGWSLCASLIADGWAAVAWAGLAAIVSYAAAAALAPRVRPLKPYARPRPILLATPAVVAVLLTGIWVIGHEAGPLGPETLAQGVAAAPRYEGSSMLLAWALDGRGIIDGSHAWARGQIEERGGWLLAAAWQAFGTVGRFWLLGLVFAGLLLPHGAGRRILHPVEADDAPPVGRRRATLAAFTVTLLGLFAIASTARLEAWVMEHQRPGVLAQAPTLSAPSPEARPPVLDATHDLRPAALSAGLPSPTDLRRAIEAERLGDLACPEGTIAGLRQLDDALRAVLAGEHTRIEAAARQGFASLRDNVPGFLDWYYSLPAEYARTGHLLAGTAEAYLKDQFREQIERGAPLAPLAAAMAALEERPELIENWRRGREALLGACGDARLPWDGGVLVTTATAPITVMLDGPSVEALDLGKRLGGAGAGGVAGGIVGVAVGKLVAKEAFGLAVEGLGKLALSKASGWLGGAAAGAGGGALAGSVVPGVGTAVGAVVGGVVGGIGAWIATDYVLLELEEAISREGFEAEILDAINEAEAAFLASLGPA